MKENVLSKLSQTVSYDLPDECIETEILGFVNHIGMAYSYLIYAKYEKEELMGWLIEYMISQTTEYNTINLPKIAHQIAKTILKNKHETVIRYVIGYRQPPEDLIITLYEPLINKLSLQQLRRWNQFDYDDLCQICRYVIIKLIRQGYYIHKNLIAKAFVNEVLMEIRKDKDKPTIVNLEEPYTDNGEDSDKLTVADMVADEVEIIAQEDELNKEAEMLIFKEMKDIIIDLIGPRRYDQLLREYGTGYTTSSGRHLLQLVKKHLLELGIDRKDFNKKYHGG